MAPDTYLTGILNAPTTTNKGGKANLLAPALRVVAMLRIFWRQAFTACGLVEVGSITKTVLRLHPRWIYMPTVNTVTRINRKGSALILRRRRFKVLERRGLKIPYRKGFRRRLVQPRVLTEDRVSGRLTLWVVAHAPRKIERVANLRVLHAVAKACKAGVDAGLNVICMMDTNNIPDADRIMAAAGMRRVARQDVLAVYASPSPGVSLDESGTIRDGVAGVITDHGGLGWARLLLRTRTGFKPVTKIPGE